MNFGPDHYVPVLKVKQGEKDALRAIAPLLRDRITPFFEIVEIGTKQVTKGGKKVERVKTLSEHLDTVFKGLATCVQGYKRCFIDTLELAPLGLGPAEEVYRRAEAGGMVFTPVTGLSRTHDVQAALAYRGHGLAIRLTRTEMEGGKLKPMLRAFMKLHALATGEVDLILDLGEIGNLIQEGVCELAKAFMAEIPEPKSWRTLTLSGCAFPKSMREVDRFGAEQVSRTEWAAWRDFLHSNRHSLQRLPAFSDCGIQHPSGVEKFDFRTMRASAAVRYALGDTWLLIKGESTKKRLASDQFPDLARRLVYGDMNGNFAGEKHCHGCLGMKRAADGAPKLGAPGVWRRLGTIHHITRTVEALAALPWP